MSDALRTPNPIPVIVRFDAPTQGRIIDRPK